MLDWWSNGESGDVLLLVPAIGGHESTQAPSWPRGRCAFLTNDERCEVHAIKPIECAVAGCRGSYPPDWREKAVIALWRTDEARSLVETWCADHDVTPDTTPTVEGDIDILFGILGAIQR